MSNQITTRIHKPSKAKIAAFAGAALMLLASAGMAVSADPITDTGTGSPTGNVEIDGTIKPLTISVTHPAVVTYTIDPNGAPTFTADTVAVTNNTVDKIDVAVQSLKSTTGGSLQFTDVEPNAHTDAEWDALSLAQSKTDLALGVGITDATGWDAGYNTATDNAADNAAVEFGKLTTDATGNFNFTAKHGLAFDQEYTAKSALVFQFSLV